MTKVSGAQIPNIFVHQAHSSTMDTPPNIHRARKRPNHLLRLVLWAIGLLVVAYLTMSAYGAYQLTHPVRWPPKTTPAAYGMQYESVTFNSVPDNIPLKGWFIDSPGTRTILVLHGESSAKDNYINMEVGKALYQQGYDLFMFDFRAHGESGGDIGSIGQFETRDVAGALAYLETRGVTQVGAIGWSMGAATLLNAAPDHPEISAIVADSSFSSLMPMIDIERDQMHAPALIDPGIVLMSRLMYGIDITANQPKKAIAHIGDRPVLLIHASGDTLIPASQAEELKQAGADDPNLQLWVVPAAGHVNSFATHRQEYLDRVEAFFGEYLP
jgi:pimeloyl-ACP methyl ester carboxylesterase